MRRVFFTSIFLCLSFLSLSFAVAHSAIADSFPQHSSTLDSVPDEVWIEFNSKLQLLDGHAVNSVEVIDSTGQIVSSKDVVIMGARISTLISKKSSAGVFTVKYRIVSEDGHPIESSYTFTVSGKKAESQEVEILNSSIEEVEKQEPVVIMALLALILIFLTTFFFRRVRIGDKNA